MRKCRESSEKIPCDISLRSGAEIVVRSWYHNFTFKWRRWMPKRIDLAAEILLCTYMYAAKNANQKKVQVLYFIFTDLFIFTIHVLFYFTDFILEIRLKLLFTTRLQLIYDQMNSTSIKSNMY